MLEWAWAVERLERSRSYWIATTREDGSPHAAPVWGLWRDDGLWFSTSPESRKGRNLLRDPRVAVHLESGDEVVMLEGEVERVTLDAAGADAYGEKYGFRPDPSDASGFWVRLRPRVAYAWREEDYPKSATRFAFG
jgi:PPOX class probable F420-dependent enzyme